MSGYFVLVADGEIVSNPSTSPSPHGVGVPFSGNDYTNPDTGAVSPDAVTVCLPYVDEPPAHDSRWQEAVPTGAVDIGADAVRVVYQIESLSAADLLARRRAELAALRWQCETAGVTIGGMTIRTDRDSQSLIDSMHRSLADGVIDTVSFKPASGDTVVADLATATAIRSAVVLHVQACRTCEAEHAAALDALAADPAVIADYDFGTGWP